MGNSISYLVRTTNAWLHAPATLRGGYVLAWGMTFGFQVWQSFIGGVVAFKTRTFGALPIARYLADDYRSAKADVRSAPVKDLPRLLSRQYPPHHRAPHARSQASPRLDQKLQGSTGGHARRPQHGPLLGLDGRTWCRGVGIESCEWGVDRAEDDRGHV